MNILKKYRNVISALTINGMESFDFVLYGYYAPLVAPLFFPDKNPKATQLKALLVFATMFVMKPLGGLIFGYVGDRYGRKTSLIASVFVISTPTLFIGLLPGHEVLGIWASILLITALSVQGLGAAAAYSGAAVFLNEHAHSRTKSFFSALLFSAGFFGATVASTLGVFFVSYYPLVGWRIVFILGGLFGFYILKLRNNLEETPAFKMLQQKKTAPNSLPLKDIIKKRKVNFICCIGIAAGANLPFYVIMIYINSILSTDLLIPNTTILFYNTCILLVWACILPLFGYMGSCFGDKKVMLISGTLLTLLPFPVMSWFLEDKTFGSLMTGRVILSLVAMGIVAPCTSFLANLYSTNERQTGMGFSYLLGSALFGGTAPFLCLYCSRLFDTQLFPAFYLSLCGLFTILSVYFARPVIHDNPQNNSLKSL